MDKRLPMITGISWKLKVDVIASTNTVYAMCMIARYNSA